MTNPNVDFFFEKNSAWQGEYKKLRTIVLDTGLAEVLKWGWPCYTLDDRNIVLIHGFKEYCALLFFKGALLQNTDDLPLHKSGNVQSARQIRFTDVSETIAREATLKAYIYEAIEVEKAGLKVELKKTGDYAVPEEFQAKLDADAKLQKAFKALTPGRQRAYLFFFSQPKQSKTREARVEKSIPQILDGKGLND